MNDYLQELKSIRSDKKQLREFGLLIGVLLIGVALYLHYKQSPYFSNVYYAVGSMFLLSAICFQKILFWPQKLWMGLAISIGWFVGRALLTVLYFFLLMPIGFVLKVKNVKLLKLRPDASATSYWTLKSVSESDPKRSEKQF